jgi:cell division protein FtsB
MSKDDKVIKEIVQANQEWATKNSKAAVDTANRTKEELSAKVMVLEKTVSQLVFQVSHLQQKYNLLLSERFNKGSTNGSEE